MKKYKQPSFIAQETDNLIIVRMNGDINKHTLPESRKMIDEIIKLHGIYEREHLSIIVDYLNVGDVDSSTIANILERIEEHRENYHRIAFINVPDEFIQLIELYKLQDHITVYETEDQAIQALKINKSE